MTAREGWPPLVHRLRVRVRPDRVVLAVPRLFAGIVLLPALAFAGAQLPRAVASGHRGWIVFAASIAATLGWLAARHVFSDRRMVVTRERIELTARLFGIVRERQVLPMSDLKRIAVRTRERPDPEAELSRSGGIALAIWRFFEGFSRGRHFGIRLQLEKLEPVHAIEIHRRRGPTWRPMASTHRASVERAVAEVERFRAGGA